MQEESYGGVRKKFTNELWHQHQMIILNLNEMMVIMAEDE